MKRFLIGFTGLVVFTTSGCALSSLLTAAPKDAIEQAVNCPTGEKATAERFKILSTQQWSQGVVVLYSAFCPTADVKTPMQQVFGHQVVKRDGMAWHVSSSGSYGAENESAPSERLVEYSVNRSSKPQQSNSAAEEPFMIVYGRVLKPKVVTVEATFNNGKTVRDESRNGVFALLSVGATGVCDLRVLGADNQILRQEEFVPQLVQGGRRTQCLPSQQL